MSASHFAPHHYPLQGGPVTYARRGFLAPGVLPLLGVVSVAIGAGVYFGSCAAQKQKNEERWHHGSQHWLRTATDRTNWDGPGGVREMLIAAGKREYVEERDKVMHMGN